MKNAFTFGNLHQAGEPSWRQTGCTSFSETLSRYCFSFWRPGLKSWMALFCLLCSGISELAAQNAIVTENAKPGNPASEWQISGGAGDLSIQGFATNISYNRGETAQFKIKTDARDYTIRIYRMGYYQGNGARFQATVPVTATLPQAQPNCITNATTGILDCGNWAASAQWVIPADAVSGVYLAKLTRTDTQGASHIVFIVRDDASTSDLFFQTSDATWQAYNIYGDNNNGRSLYTGAGGKAVKVSYNRPFITRNGGGGGGAMEDWLFNAEYPMIRWIEANGYNVSYTTDVDSDRRGNLITKHKVFMSVGHDEYWSGGQRTAVTAARNSGTHLAFFSGNEVYWKTRWENSVDGTGTAYRTLVCYKEGSLGENVCNGKCDPTPEWTGLWRSGCEFPGSGGCDPENALTGQISWEEVTTAITVPGTYKNLRFWRNTNVASQANGQTATLTFGTIGYECSAELEQYRAAYPSGRMRLSQTDLNGKTHHLSLYRHSSGAWVFGAGTVQYSWGLDRNHDRGNAAPNPALQQATVNLFADMGAQPGSLQTGLVAATASSDTQAPVTAITSPATGAELAAGSALTISGTASDATVVAGVEVSTDGGATWRLATGTTNWTFAWTPATPGAATIQCRAFDDSGNLSATLTRNVVISGSGEPACPCTVFKAADAPAGTLVNDGRPVQLGMKFRASVAGNVTGVRFYKQSGNTGTHIGQLYSSTGTMLAQATFVNETESGWQQVAFSAPVAITANTTYVVTYHSSAGHYSTNDFGFNQPIVNGILSGLQNGTDGPNGVYLYTNTPAFPTQNFASSNYYVDVVFDNGGTTGNQLPTVAITSPANNAAFPAPASIAIAADAADADGTIAKVEFYQGTTLLGEDATSPYTFTWADVAAGTYSVTAKATDNAGGVKTSEPVSVTVTGTSGACPCTLFQAADAPAGALMSDGRALQLGMKFRSSVDGNVTGVRFYKQIGNTGAHTGQLYSSTGTMLAQATFVNETESGWQQVNFSAPVAITANTTYVISYHSSQGFYSGANSFFGQAADRSPLRGLANGEDGPNGVYLYTNTPAFPTRNYQASNYYVDVVFDNGGTAENQLPTVAITSPANNAAFPAPASIAIAADAADADGTIAKVEFYQGTTLLGEDLGSPYTFTWADVAAGTYSVTAKATDNAGGVKTSEPVSVTVTASSGACPCTLFQAADAPTGALLNDTMPVQLGVKFRASVAGYVTGVRFYKQIGNTGTHIGQLYNRSGTMLAQATFVNETESGWQQVNFSAPVAITANTTYVISYHSSSGYYSETNPFFAQAKSNGPLKALANGEDGRNGIYRYSNTAAFPTIGYETANYWVDLVFNTSIPAGNTGSPLAVGSPAASSPAAGQGLEMQEGWVIYPNPFFDTARVRFVLAQDGPYTVGLYDTNGRLVEVLKQGQAHAGEPVFLEVDGAKLVNGLYLLRLQSGNRSQAARLMLRR